MEAKAQFQYEVSTSRDHIFHGLNNQVHLLVDRGFFPHDYVPETITVRLDWIDPKVSAEDLPAPKSNPKTRKPRAKKKTGSKNAKL